MGGLPLEMAPHPDPPPAAWGEGAMSLLARVRAAAPGVRFEAALPVRVAPSFEPSAALDRIARRLRIELDGVGETLVLLNDESRTANPPLIAAVLRVALAQGRVRVLFARGSHPPPTPADHVALTFSSLTESERQALVVEPQPGRLVSDAEKIVPVGTVEPHYFAGWTGAHKTATIGVLDREGIRANHAHALSPASAPLALDGNPVFDGIARMADALGPRLTCVNAVEADGRLLAWSVGPWRAALDQVLPEATTVFVRDIPHRVDLLVAAVTGPLARNLYQAEKGIKNSESCVKDGGAVVLHAPCPEGTGPARFLELLARARTHEAALASVQAAYELGDHKAVKVRALEARGVTWHLACPGISTFPAQAALVEKAGLALHASLEEAIGAATATPRATGLLVEDAGNLVVRVRANQAPHPDPPPAARGEGERGR